MKKFLKHFAIWLLRKTSRPVEIMTDGFIVFDVDRQLTPDTWHSIFFCVKRDWAKLYIDDVAIWKRKVEKGEIREVSASRRRSSR